MTDKRWKAVERGAAAELNCVLSGIGKFTPVERIPLLGREGPDLTINEAGLVINVKSRNVIPTYLFPPINRVVSSGHLLIFRLNEMSQINYNPILSGYMVHPSKIATVKPWKQLQDWYDWMDRWTKQCRRECISAIFLHHSRMPYGNMGVVIHSNDLRRLSCNLSKTNPSL